MVPSPWPQIKFFFNSFYFFDAGSYMTTKVEPIFWNCQFSSIFSVFWMWGRIWIQMRDHKFRFQARFQDSRQHLTTWGNKSGLGALCQDLGQQNPINVVQSDAPLVHSEMYLIDAEKTSQKLRKASHTLSKQFCTLRKQFLTLEKPFGALRKSF